MITSAEEYNEFLYLIQSNNQPTLAILPSTEEIYDIDLNSRKVNTPDFLSVQYDHKAETIYFKVDRFYDYMDLSTTVCMIQYINAKGEPRIYVVPFYDITTFSKDDKMVFPWCLDGGATIASGTVQFSIRFYKIGSVEEKDESGKVISSKQQIVYNLNTLITFGQVLHGIDVQEANPDYDISPTLYEELMARIKLVEDKDIYWDDLYDE